MSLEAIEKVTEVERKNKERRAAAETEAKQMLTSAQRDGLALLEQMRAEEAAKGAELLRQAEERAAQRSEQIGRFCRGGWGDALRRAAESRLQAAAEFIVGRIVED